MTQANPSTSSPQRLLRLPEVESRVGLRKSSIYEMLGRNPPAFPKPVKLSRRAVCWPESAIDAWITERIKAGGQS
ncbi:MAG: AlpA family phage regulatory protein [Hylemonella sp.]|nr:AlpA family phage regulatory protein [Hylemonella sp.]